MDFRKGFRFAAIVALVAAMIIIPLGVSYGQESAPSWVGQQVPPKPLAAAQTAPAATPLQNNMGIFLPLMIAGYNPLQFSAAVDSNTGAPVNPTDTFNYGILDLYISSRVGGMPNVSYRIDIIPPGSTTAQISDTYPASNQQFYAVLPICYSSSGGCASGKNPLPRGTYRAQLFANNELVREDVAVIR